MRSGKKRDRRRAGEYARALTGLNGRETTLMSLARICLRIGPLVVLAALVCPAADVPAAPLPETEPAVPPALNSDADDPPFSAFLDLARRAIATGRLAEAEEALEQAESRALIRAVRPSLADQPSRQPVVADIRQARAALAGGDRMEALTLIDEAADADAAEPQ